jgi:hypothetical protein
MYILYVLIYMFESFFCHVYASYFVGSLGLFMWASIVNVCVHYVQMCLSLFNVHCLCMSIATKFD